ncbi:SEC-C domain-containing protein [Enterobacter sp. 638]|nr:SEC-C domain-containing protein [Enterobacter sp. 638]
MERIGRNDACWCGSEKKYKKCHLGRDKQERFTRGEAQQVLKLFTTVSKCSVPDDLKHECQTRIVKAHTLSKGNSLKAISHEGHVLGLKHGFGGLERNDGRLTLERIGINQASTFTGFCSYHDKELFSCVEDMAFIGTKEQCTMLAYRPMMREFYVKKANYKVMGKTRDFDRGRSFVEQLAWAKMAQENIDGAKLSLSDLEYLKVRIEDSIKKHSYDCLNHMIINLNEVPAVMACGMHAPIVDIFGNEIQEITDQKDLRPAYIITNLLALDGNGYMIFSWLPEDDEVILKFVNSITYSKLDELGDRLTNYIFTFLENVFASELWWDSLGEKQERVKDLMMQGVRMHIYDLSLIKNESYNYNAISVKDFVRIF